MTGRWWRAAFAATLCLAAPVWAQTTTGRISGSVKDGSGGVLPGVTIGAAEVSTGVVYMTTTDERGAYLFVNVPRGRYDVSAELAGFRKGMQAGYELVADGRITVNFVLEVGLVTEVLDVSAPSGETVNTLSGEVARTIDREQVQNLALNGRNYMQLATLVPGAPLLDDNALNIITGLGINTSVNGSRANSSLLMVDGGFNMDSGGNNSQISSVGIDFIEEVNIKSSSFSAEYGRNAGAAINVVTRSGANSLAGSLYEYRRDERLDANDYFSNARNVPRSSLEYDNFGWSLGGPLRKNKVFFFGGQEWKRIRRLTAPTLRTLPTRAMRGGDFSAIPGVIRDPNTGQPFPGNVIPASRITADGRAIANVYTAMERRAGSYRDTPTVNNALYEGPNPFDFRQDLLRFDIHASATHRVMVRLIHDDYDLEDPYGTFITSNLPTITTNRTRPSRNYQFGHTWTLNASMINELKVGAAWNSQTVEPLGDTWKRETYGFQFPQLFAGGGRFENSIPDVTVQNYAGFAGAARSLLSPTRDIQVTNTLTWITGPHAFKLGGLYARNSKDQNGRSVYAGNVSFNTTGNTRTTGHAFADALLGNFRSYQEAQTDQVGYFRFAQVEAFVTDNWRLSPKVSLEAGLRYVWHQPIYAVGNNMANFDPARYAAARAVTVNRDGTIVPGSGDLYNGLIRAGTGVPAEELARVPNGDTALARSIPAGAARGFYQDHHLLMPRFSVAYSPDEGRTALRGGVGLFYDRSEGNLLYGGTGNGPINNPPYSLSASYENGNLAAPGGGTLPAPAPLGTIAAIDPGLKVPYFWNWNASLQREVGGGVFAEIAYVGSRGGNLLRQPDINQASFEALGANAALPAAQRANVNFLRPYKGYSVIAMRLTDAESSYDALQVFLSRRTGGFRWTLSYTHGKSTDTGSGNGDNPEDYKNKAFNEGPSDFDRTHIAVGTWTWRLPLFNPERGVGRVLGGWEVSGIGRFQSGAPITVVGSTAIGNRRADLLGGDPYAGQGVDNNGIVRWLNAAAFAPAPDGRRGNTRRGQFRGPSLTVFDLSLRKQFAITGRVKLQLQADLFNVLNHTSFRNPVASVTDAGFGTITAAAPPRNVQLGTRLTF